LSENKRWIDMSRVGVYEFDVKRGPWTEDRFMERVAPDPNSGCWLWLAAVHTAGYGKIASKMYAHRWSYEHFNGPIGDGRVVRHKCDTPACVNPRHLAIGTQKDNSQDSVARGRHTYGERHPNARLTADEARAIRDADADVRHVDLAKRFGVSRSHVSGIRSGRFWGHLD